MIAPNTSNDSLPIRRETLNMKDMLYSFALQWKRPWLWKRSNQLDHTIIHIVNPVKGGKQLFSRLIKKFKYIEATESNRNIQQIASHIKDVWKCDKNNTLIMSVRKKSNRHPDGSAKMLYDLQNALGNWNNRLIIDPFDETDKRIGSGMDVVLCDDFIGSGSTMHKRIDSIKATMPSSSRLYVVTLAAMKDSKHRYFPDSDIEIYSPVWLEKGIDDKLSEAIMLQMEQGLAPKYKSEKIKDCSMGYGKTGSLYFNEEYRIPNNVYPIFWWGLLNGGIPFRSLFLRS